MIFELNNGSESDSNLLLSSQKTLDFILDFILVPNAKNKKSEIDIALHFETKLL